MSPLRVVVIALVTASAGCVYSTPGSVQDGVHEEMPLRESGYRTLDGRGFDVVWTDPETGVTRPFRWLADRSEWRDGVFTVSTPEFTVNYRVDEPVPVRLRFDADLSRSNSFNLSYTEANETAGRTLTRVVDAHDSSFIDIKTSDPVDADVGGDFILRFEATCDAEDEGCDDPGNEHTVLLHGYFPPRNH